MRCLKENVETKLGCSLCRRENRIPIGETINIVGALKNDVLRAELEDDVVSGMEVDSLNEVKFFTRVQIRGRIIHSRVYTCFCEKLLHSFVQRWQPN